MTEFKVYLNGKHIDSLFYSKDTTETAEDVKRSLINHDRYDPAITVKQIRGKK